MSTIFTASIHAKRKIQCDRYRKSKFKTISPPQNPSTSNNKPSPHTYILIILTRIELEVKLSPVVHPHERHPGEIPVEYIVDAAGERVRRRLAKDVTDVGAGRYLDAAAALPDAKGQLQVLAAPDAHALVVAAELVEVGTVHGEEATGHRRRLERVDDALATLAQQRTVQHQPAEV